MSGRDVKPASPCACDRNQSTCDGHPTADDHDHKPASPLPPTTPDGPGHHRCTACGQCRTPCNQCECGTVSPGAAKQINDLQARLTAETERADEAERDLRLIRQTPLGKAEMSARLACEERDTAEAEAKRRTRALETAWATVDRIRAEAKRLREVVEAVPGWVREQLESGPGHSAARATALATRIAATLSGGAGDEVRCAECDDRHDVGPPESRPIYCYAVGPRSCTQDDGPAPEWCPRRKR